MDWNSSKACLVVVAVFHFVFFAIEVFLWRGLEPKVGLYEPEAIERAASAAVANEDPSAARAVTHAVDVIVALGRNAGLYNGVLAGMLICLVVLPNLDPRAARSLALYLLSSIVILGLYGGWKLEPKIPLYQSLPAALALIVVYRSPVGPG